MVNCEVLTTALIVCFRQRCVNQKQLPWTTQ
jgi:hypothetical protein